MWIAVPSKLVSQVLCTLSFQPKIKRWDRMIRREKREKKVRGNKFTWRVHFSWSPLSLPPSFKSLTESDCNIQVHRGLNLVIGNFKVDKNLVLKIIKLTTRKIKRIKSKKKNKSSKTHNCPEHTYLIPTLLLVLPHIL